MKVEAHEEKGRVLIAIEPSDSELLEWAGVVRLLPPLPREREDCALAAGTMSTMPGCWSKMAVMGVPSSEVEG